MQDIFDVKQRLEEHGFSVGKASIMEPYFPNSIARAIAMAGAASLCVLAFVLIFPAAFKFGYVIEIAVLLLTQGLFLADAFRPAFADACPWMRCLHSGSCCVFIP